MGVVVRPGSIAQVIVRRAQRIDNGLELPRVAARAWPRGGRVACVARCGGGRWEDFAKGNGFDGHGGFPCACSSS